MFHHEEMVDLLLTHIPSFPDINIEADRNTLTYAMLGLLSNFDPSEGCTDVYRKTGVPILPLTERLVLAGAEVDSRAFWTSVGDPMHMDIVRVLLDNGLQVNDTRSWGQFNCCDSGEECPSMLFSIVGDTVDDTFVLEEFIAKGTSVTMMDRNTDTPLPYAAHCSFAKLLLEHGADMDAKSSQGRTPLYRACKDNRLAVANLLLAKGADVNVITRDEGWLSPMPYAMKAFCVDR